MADINKHPILKQCYELCLAIEKLPCSVLQTVASGKASELLQALADATEQSAGANSVEEKS